MRELVAGHKTAALALAGFEASGGSDGTRQVLN